MIRLVVSCRVDSVHDDCGKLLRESRRGANAKGEDTDRAGLVL